jgi:hypothetical protein
LTLPTTVDCKNPDCRKSFQRKRADQEYHSASCRERAKKARKRDHEGSRSAGSPIDQLADKARVLRVKGLRTDSDHRDLSTIIRLLVEEMEAQGMTHRAKTQLRSHRQKGFPSAASLIAAYDAEVAMMDEPHKAAMLELEQEALAGMQHGQVGSTAPATNARLFEALDKWCVGVLPKRRRQQFKRLFLDLFDGCGRDHEQSDLIAFLVVERIERQVELGRRGVRPFRLAQAATRRRLLEDALALN